MTPGILPFVIQGPKTIESKITSLNIDWSTDLSIVYTGYVEMGRKETSHDVLSLNVGSKESETV